MPIPLTPLGRFNATVSSLGFAAHLSGDASAGPSVEGKGILSPSTVGAVIGVIVVLTVGSLYFVRKWKKWPREKKEKGFAGKGIEVSEDEL